MESVEKAAGNVTITDVIAGRIPADMPTLSLDKDGNQEIIVTPEMIEAGYDCLRRFEIGRDLKEIVSLVYIVMESERRDQASKLSLPT